MTMQNNINIFGRTLRRNVLQSKLQSTADKIDNQRPLEIGVAISANDCDRRTDRAQFVQNPFRANVAEVPGFIRVAREIDNFLRQLVMRVGDDKNSKNTSHQSLKKAGTQEGEIISNHSCFPAFLRNIPVVILCVLCVRH